MYDYYIIEQNMAEIPPISLTVTYVVQMNLGKWQW